MTPDVFPLPRQAASDRSFFDTSFQATPPPPAKYCPAQPQATNNTRTGSVCDTAQLLEWYGSSIQDNVNAVPVAFDITSGAVVWSSINRSCASDTSPVLDSDSGYIFFSCDSVLPSSVAGILALDGITRSEAWFWAAPINNGEVSESPKRAFSDPVVTRFGLVVWSSLTEVVALRIGDGAAVWQINGTLKSQPSATDQFLFLVFTDTVLRKIAPDGTDVFDPRDWCLRASLPASLVSSLGYNGIRKTPMLASKCISYACYVQCQKFDTCGVDALDLLYIATGNKVYYTDLNGTYMDTGFGLASMLTAPNIQDAGHGMISSAQGMVAMPYVYSNRMKVRLMPCSCPKCGRVVLLFTNFIQNTSMF